MATSLARSNRYPGPCGLACPALVDRLAGACVFLARWLRKGSLALVWWGCRICTPLQGGGDLPPHRRLPARDSSMG